MTLKQEQMLGAKITLLSGVINRWDAFNLASTLGQLADPARPLYISAIEKLVKDGLLQRMPVMTSYGETVRTGYAPTPAGRKALVQMKLEHETTLKHAKR